MNIDPRDRPTVTVVVSVHLSVRPHFSKSHKPKQFSGENSDPNWRGYGSGRMDHWWDTCLISQSYFLFLQIITSTGVSAFAVHGRTKEERPNNEVHLDVITEVVKVKELEI